jgi:hypothetical protein
MFYSEVRRSQLAITGVAVEKVRFLEKRPKIGHPKCIHSRRSSFIGHPDATIFQRDLPERLFQQPQAISQVTPGNDAPYPVNLPYGDLYRNVASASSHC